MEVDVVVESSSSLRNVCLNFHAILGRLVKDREASFQYANDTFNNIAGGSMVEVIKLLLGLGS